jgi:hypothetical protein
MQVVVDGRCLDEVWFHFHDLGDDEQVASDFLEFVAQYGLRSLPSHSVGRFLHRSRRVRCLSLEWPKLTERYRTCA